MARGEQGRGDGIRQQYAAFISYSHADAAAAAKLQRKLERYRLPKHIVVAHNRDTAALGRIFRDREDLAAATNLTEAIRAAIADAEALIILCSPNAAKSQWVAAEISLFQELHPDRPILAAIVSGDPDEAFPAALTDNGGEPLAADLRPDGDGGSLGFLKIVAGIAGVPLDALVQRDAQRRIRRVTAITLVTSALVVIMGVMTAFAITAQNEAARQRASAEGLVEYMLTDLRTELRGVGRLEVMDDVNDRAMDHYRQQGNLSALPADSLERRARVLHAMGEDDDKRGKPKAALVKFREAHRATAALLAQNPGSGDRIFAHAQSEYWVGYMHYLQKDMARTEEHWSNYRRLAVRLAADPAEKRRGVVEIGYATNNLCALAVETQVQAVERCRQAVEAQRRVAALDPGNRETQISLANSIAWYADAVETRLNLPLATELRNEQVAILDALLAKDPRNMDIAEFHVTALTALSRLDRKSGRTDAAQRRLHAARNTATQLLHHDPNNAVWANRLERIDAERRKLALGDQK
jgi:tetratricopeptide (TPR) repeat protein